LTDAAAVGPLLAAETDDLRARFSIEGPPAWEEYRNYVEQLQGTVNDSGSRGDKSSSVRFEYKSKQNCKIFINQEEFPGSIGQVHGFNTKYRFTLTRKSAEGGWVLQSLQQGNMGYTPKEWAEWLTPLRAHIFLWSGIELPLLIKQPTFRVVHAYVVREGDANLVAIDFDNTHAIDSAPDCLIQSGSLLLDPDRFWTLRRCLLHHKYSDVGDLTLKIEYVAKDPSAKYPIPKRMSAIHVPKDPKAEKSIVDHVWEFDLREAARPPADTEFTLSAFGLPEPVGVTWEKPRSRTWIWLLVGAVSAALLAFVFRRLKRRHGMALTK